MSSTESEESTETKPGTGEVPPPPAEGEEELSAAEDDLEESLDIEVEADAEADIEAKAEAEPEDPMDALKAQLSALEEEKKAAYDRFLRASADMENLRKRSRRELKDARIEGKGKVLGDMLPVIDNLERALAHTNESEATKSIVEGIELVLRSFQQALERHQVKAVEAEGKPFDPAVHEAVSQAPSADHPPGTVISVLQTGYTIEERLLRPALAVVSIKMEATVESSEAEASDDAGESEE